MKVVVTGASGFLGRYLINVLRDSGHEVTAASRSRVEIPGIFYASAPELGPGADWRDSLQDVDAVVHLAGRAHVTSEKANTETQQSYFRINTDGTKALAHQAAVAGLKHFVLLSSCHAVRAQSDDMITDDTKPDPVSAYGRSKLAAEKALQEELRGSACAWTILRPPLVYGPGNKANFGLLLKLVKTGIPLPLGSVRNQRSFLYVENLTDLIVNCLGTPKAFGKIFLPSDGEDVSTPDLIRAIARANPGAAQGAGSGEQGDRINTRHPSPATRHSARLFPFPPSLLKAAGRLPGLGALKKLTSSLYVDSKPILRDLGWTPPFSMEEGLQRTLGEGLATDRRR